MTDVAITQSNYIPWVGYFNIINKVDIFVIYDEAQYTRRDWRNRNYIKSPNGRLWLTIPCEVKNKYTQIISEVNVTEGNWREKHWKTLMYLYQKSDFFKNYKEIFEELYLDSYEEKLSKINMAFINNICNILNISTKIIDSSSIPKKNKNCNATERLIEICNFLNAKRYISGPAAKSYFDEDLAKKFDIEVEWFKYRDNINYKQMFGPFIKNLSVLDMLFNIGSSSTEEYLM